MSFELHPSALLELNLAIEYYEERQTGLGWSFSQEVHSAIDRILEFPLAWPTILVPLRRCLIEGFPYGVIYFPHQTYIYVVAIAHFNRQPNYWVERLKN